MKKQKNLTPIKIRFSVEKDNKIFERAYLISRELLKMSNFPLNELGAASAKMVNKVLKAVVEDGL